MDSLHGFLLFLDSLDFVALDCFLGFYSSRNLFIHGILFRGISLFLAMPFIESLGFHFVGFNKMVYPGYGFMASHGIYAHGFISWIHSIHDFGSFSVGSEIFLFLESWGVTALDVFLFLLRFPKLLTCVKKDKL